MPISFSATSPNTEAHYAVINVPVADFMLYARISTSSISQGQQGQYELFVSSLGVPTTISVPFANPVSFSCSGLPAGTSCSFSPATVTPNSQAVVVLSVITPKPLALLGTAAVTTQAQLMFALLLPGMVIAISGNVRRKKNVFVGLLIVVLALAILMPACGGGGSSSGPPAPQPPPPPSPSSPPPPVSYNFTVTATSGTVQHQLPLTLVVQGK